jgi:hypothetical protein
MPFLAVDVETYERRGEWLEPVLDARKFSVGVVLHEDGTHHVFFNAEWMWEHIQNEVERNAKRKKNTYIYAHNHSYDFSSYAQKHLLDVKHVLWKPFLAIRGKGYYLDTTSFFRMKLDELGELVGVEKKEMPKRVRNATALVDYCLRDCEIVMRSIVSLKASLATIGVKPRKMLTAGQLAMTSWQSYIRKNEMHRGIMARGTIYRSENWRKTRYAFRGGRVEVFERGTFHNATMVDVNAMYPSVMRNMRFPDLRTPYYIEYPKRKDWEVLLDLIGVAEAVVQTPDEGVGYLPVIVGKTTYYPTGGRTIVGRWTLLELKQAEKEGYHIEEIRWVEAYLEGTNPFTGYIDHLYELRKSGDTLLNGAVKLVMNNLFGKFSQYRQSKELRLVRREDYTEDEGEIVGEMGADYVCERATGEMIRTYTNPLISTLITAEARDRLYDAMKKIGWEKVLYCDTDGIIIEGKVPSWMPISKKIGEWSIKETGRCVIKRRKSYVIGRSVHIAGLDRSKQTEAALNAPQEQKTMVSLRTALGRGRLDLTGSFETRSFEVEDEEEETIPGYIDETRRYKY